MPAATLPAAAHLPQVSLRPLLALLDDVALIERAAGPTPDPSSGHRVADAGAALALAVSLTHDRCAEQVARRCFEFLASMHLGGGRFRASDRAAGPIETATDSDGRAIEGIGTAAAQAAWPDLHDAARELFTETLEFDGTHARDRAYGALGAAAVALGPDPIPGAAEMVARLTAGIDGHLADEWPWPEPTVHPGDAVIAEALLAAADVADDRRLADHALRLLRWLAALETEPGHFSPVPVGGRHRDGSTHSSIQKPISAAALSAAAARALRLTGDRGWERPVIDAAGWYAGANDLGLVVFDRDTYRSYDALGPDGVSLDEGAEAAVSFTMVLRELQRLRQRRTGAPAGADPRQ